MLFAGRTFSADALRGLRRPSHKTQYDSETVTLSRFIYTPEGCVLVLWKKYTLQDMRNALPTITLRNSSFSALCARHKKIRIISSFTVILKHCQLDFFKAYNSNFDYLSSIFPENFWIFGQWWRRSQGLSTCWSQKTKSRLGPWTSSLKCEKCCCWKVLLQKTAFKKYTYWHTHTHISLPSYKIDQISIWSSFTVLR